jgi:DAK2 domain fusion protein YloV
VPEAVRALEELTAADLRSGIVCFRDLLRSHREFLNSLNVYPVPDADTGTNMTLTVDSVVVALGQATDMASTCQIIGHAALLGARGISGVILSQVLRAAADRFTHEQVVDGAVMAEALAEASGAADRAVAHPVEGTILTVTRQAATAAVGAAAANASLARVLEAARAAGHDALLRTPELLPALKQAGVVDAGGAGLVLLLEALLHVATGHKLPTPPPLTLPVAPAMRSGLSRAPRGPQYEVVFLLETRQEHLDDLKAAWSRIGGSVVAVGGGGLWRCHVHTDQVEGVLEAARARGRVREVRVTDLAEQVDQQRRAGARPVAKPGLVRTAVVAVAAGPGIGDLLRSLGASRVIAGGPQLSPSTAELLEAIEAAPAGEVVVLPNDQRIIPAARQAARLSGKTVRVVPTNGVVEGLVALFGYDRRGSAPDNAEAMAAQAARVRSGAVTRAVRDAIWQRGEIHAGDWLGIVVTGGIRAVRPDLVDAAVGLLEVLVREDDAIVVIVEGEGSSSTATGHIVAWVGQHHPQVAVEVLQGGQPLYPYVFGVELSEEREAAHIACDEGADGGGR